MKNIKPIVFIVKIITITVLFYISRLYPLLISSPGVPQEKMSNQ